jgi:hypothetical protein
MTAAGAFGYRIARGGRYSLHSATIEATDQFGSVSVGYRAHVPPWAFMDADYTP